MMSTYFFLVGLVWSGLMFWIADAKVYPMDYINLTLSAFIIFFYGTGLFVLKKFGE